MNTNNPTPAVDSVSGISARSFTKAKPLAKRVGVSTKSLFRWADAGHIHRHKINDRVVLFDEAEVLAFIDKSKVA